MSEWISVGDRLPAAEVWVLWIDSEKTMGHHETFHHVDKINCRKEALVNYLHNYTHWMPLPEAPKGE